MKLPRLLLIPILVVNLNESPAIKWPSVTTIDQTTVTTGSPVRLRVSLDSYCFFNHPSLPTGTIISGTAKINRTSGTPSVEFRASNATMRDGREVTFAERKWTLPLDDTAKTRYQMSEGTHLNRGHLSKPHIL